MKAKRDRRPANRALPATVALLGALVCPPMFAWEPVQLERYPQKVRTFFRVDDPQVPAALHTKPAPLPVCGVTAAAVASDGAYWLGTTQGLMRLDFAAPERDRRQYLAGRRYLPDDQVLNVLPEDARGVWVRTATGVSHIELRPLRPAQKAEYFEKRIRDRHDRYGLVADSRLKVPGDVSSNQLLDNDNDGLWTALYAAAECFRHAVTKSPDALARARKSVEAILFLEDVAGRRGFPARSFIRKGDPPPRDGEWHWTPDGQYYWKGDTSSDEIVGHFFIFSVAWDLWPHPDLKERIAETATRIMNHIIDHGYNLIDTDGQPTRWGWWSPERLAREPEEMALNSLQLLSFLKTTAHITGQRRYTIEYEKVAGELKYTNLILRLNECRTELNYSDEELALLPFYTLFRYEKDPVLLTCYRAAMDQWWKNIQREANPLWTFIYLTGKPDAPLPLSDTAWTLYRMPMDTISWTVRNSHRQDLVRAARPDRFGRPEYLTLLPPDERPVMRWNENPFVVDGGQDGYAEDDGAAFLCPYWMGRFHGFLKEE
jgi:hypothetical protein